MAEGMATALTARAPPVTSIVTISVDWHEAESSVTDNVNMVVANRLTVCGS
jgi:hypothetical protein